MVIEVCVNSTTFILFLSCLSVFTHGALSFSLRCPFWHGGYASWSRRDIERLGCDSGVLDQWKEEAKVAVLSSAKRALFQSRVRRQELVDILDGNVVGFYRLIGE